MKQMSGIPRPVDDLPDGAVSVRVIRGSLENVIKNQPVTMTGAGRSETVDTDQDGRAEFKSFPPGTPVRAATTVDGEALASQEFATPVRGGVRMLLVATDKSAAAPSAPAVPGKVVLGGQSRIVVEPGDEAVQVYYLLDIINTGKAPVALDGPFIFDTPREAVGTSLLDGSSPQASVNGRRVRVQGPFPPGTTLVQVACEIPSYGGRLSWTQTFPAAFEQLAVIVTKVPGLTLVSPQIASQQDMTAQGQTFIAATGGAIPAGQTVSLTLDGLPHHSPLPRYTALTLAVLIIAGGTWAATRREDAAAAAEERKQLVARRERLFADLVRLEADHRNGRLDGTRYVSRREELVSSLEQVYGALDDDDSGPQPAGRPGVAA